MKLLVKIASVFSLLLLFSFVSPEKKVNKLVEKIWKDRKITMTQVTLPDSLKSNIIQLNEVYSKGELLGFACYTTAFGCKIGGCAAPTTPNANAFETFDYIVIYDADLKIIKVDIASYTGQYGYEICRARWLAQFNGANSGFELENNIDGISGATVSATYLINDLNMVGKTLQEVLSLTTL